MRSLFLLSALLVSSAAFAQADNSMLVVGQQQRPASEVEQERLVNEFPDWAVTRAGAATGGHDQDVVPTPAAAPTPQGTAAPTSPAAPTPPAVPANAVDTLWPVDTVPIFMRSCVGYQPKLVVPCNCVIGQLMVKIPHDEFLRLTALGTIEQDPRLQNIRVQCAVEAAAK